jgi:SAM-dependent methyltransferase
LALGIGRAAIALLLEEAAARPFSGKIATLGRQTIGATSVEIKAQFDRFGILPQQAMAVTDPDDNILFRMMGFTSVESLDYSDFENATHIVDLNRDGLPRELVGKFDVVLESGTIEHVFHVPNALKNALSLVKEGGRIIFLSPSSNYVDHGFYMFSPTLFMDYLLTNGLSIETCYFIRVSLNSRKRWQAYAYERDSFRKFSIGALDSRPYMIFAVATKTRGSTTDKVPQQNFYMNQWATKTGLARHGKYERYERILRRIPGALELASAFWPIIARRGRWGLRYVADY